MIRHFPPGDAVGKLIDEPLTLEALIAKIEAAGMLWGMQRMKSGWIKARCGTEALTGARASGASTALRALTAAAKEAGIL